MFSFTIEEFLTVLERYNLSIWPIQIVAYTVGVVALFFTIKSTKYSDRIILSILSFYWLWNGIVFCPIYWGPTYKYAYGFGILCVVQGLLFLRGVIKSDLSIRLRPNLHSLIGLLFVIYAMAGYQVFGYFLGHVYPKFFPFGLVPCPTTIFTFGLFLMTKERFGKYLLIIPLIVTVVGFLAVYKGVLEDIGLITAGFLSTVLLLRRDRKTQS